MEIICSGCQQKLTYEVEPPRFCHHCGQPVVAEGTESKNRKTAFVDSEATVAPSTFPGASTAATSGISQGDMIGIYEVVRMLGSGGMGVVWEAIETTTGRRIALKQLSKSMLSDKEQVQRFIREGQLAAQLSHPNVTFIYGSGEHNGQPYIAMELMPGLTLEDRIKDSDGEQLPVAESIDALVDVCDGLIAAHDLGLIHRDVKPSNCFLDTDGSVKVGDFGLSKSLLSTDVNLTQTGTFMGTPSYAAPEQIRGDVVDVRTDVYSVGATLFHMLARRTPFVGDAMSVTAQIISDPAPAVREINENVPTELSKVVAKCLAKDPAKRFQTLDQLRLALLPFASGRHSLANIGRRMAAYMIDSTMLQTIFSVALGSMGIIFAIRNGPESVAAMGKEVPEEMAAFVFWSGVVIWLITILYYAIFEGLFGVALGKRLMGLRVVDGEGQRPGFWRGLLRGFALPGFFGLTLLYLTFVKPQMGATNQILTMIQAILINLLPMLAIICTMRATNGFRGIHGLFSGTRVTRLETGGGKISVPVVLPRQSQIEKQQFGPYHCEALMGASVHGKVFLGRDELLNRDVWVVESKDGTPPDLRRINLARLSRQRWLEGGDLSESDDGFQRWDAYEAIKGVPIQTLVGTKTISDWQTYSQMLLDIVRELTAAMKDQTLPSSLALPQVWLAEDGRAKLLDRQLVEAVSYQLHDAPNHDPLSTPEQLSDVQRSVKLLKEIGDLLLRTNTFPESGQDFLTQLNSKPNTNETLNWAAEELEVHSKKLGTIAWDSRIGILGMSLGVELPIYYITAGLIFLASYFALPVPNPLKFPAGVGLSLILPAIFGYLFHGGAVFKFMKIQPCNSKGRPSNRIICALRNVLSWLPAICLIGTFLLVLIGGEVQMGTIEITPGSIMADLKRNPAIVLMATGVGLLALLAIAVGFVVALISPKRGLVDFLLGTRLMPK